MQRLIDEVTAMTWYHRLTDLMQRANSLRHQRGHPSHQNIAGYAALPFKPQELEIQEIQHVDND